MPGDRSNETDRSPLVSVAMTAFNSEAWIARAIESVLLQSTDFAVEIVVGDDGSADSTASIVRSYREKYPEKINLLARSKNVGMQRNYYEVFAECRGRYVAWLDADDYWTDPEKLALQVEALEKDASISICSHFVRFVNSSGAVSVARYPNRPAGRYTLRDIVRQNFVPSPSIMFRNGLHRELSDWFFELSAVTDWPILLVGGLQGDILLLDRVMADYHSTPGSSYNAKGFLYQHSIDLEVRERMAGALPAKWHRDIRAGLGKQYETLAYQLRMAGDFAGARRAALKAFREPALVDNCASKVKTLAAAVLGRAATKVRRGIVPVVSDDKAGV